MQIVFNVSWKTMFEVYPQNQIKYQGEYFHIFKLKLQWFRFLGLPFNLNFKLSEAALQRCS